MKYLVFVFVAVALVCTVQCADDFPGGMSPLSPELGTKTMNIIARGHDLCKDMGEFYSLCWLAVKTLLSDEHIDDVRALMAAVKEFEDHVYEECKDECWQKKSDGKDEELCPCMTARIEASMALFRKIERKYADKTRKSGEEAFNEVLEENSHIKDEYDKQNPKDDQDRDVFRRVLTEIIDKLDKKSKQ